MRIALIALSKNAALLSERISCELSGSERHVFYKYADDEAFTFNDIKKLTSELFPACDALVYICACGIAVRAVAPLIKSKFTDPAVVALDEGGRFAVPLLSGHMGGANALAEKIAGITGATAVITTATDVGGRFSPDSFAKANGLYLCEPDISKEAAAAVLRAEKLGLYSDYTCLNIPKEITSAKADIGLCISASADKRPFQRTLHLVPKNITVGVGCRKNTQPAALEAFIFSSLEKQDIPFYRVKELRTIDIKRGERAILAFGEKYSLPLKFYSAEALMSVKGDFTSSDFVMKTVGADNVCERSAVYGGLRLIAGKTSGGGITFAAAEEDITIDFERKVLW